MLELAGQYDCVYTRYGMTWPSRAQASTGTWIARQRGFCDGLDTQVSPRRLVVGVRRIRHTLTKIVVYVIA
jgi:hypothetical protein